MDRVISDEERIRRAEEIAFRRRNRISASDFNNTENEKYKVSKFGKFFLQTIISICIFGIMYFISQNYSYAMEKIKPVMDDDTNFNMVYGYMNNIFYDIMGNEVDGNEQSTQNDENSLNGSGENQLNSNEVSSEKNEKNEIDNPEKDKTSKINENNQNDTIENASITGNEKTGTYDLKDGEKISVNSSDNDEKSYKEDENLDDVSYIKKYANIIKPVNGTVTSWYGERTATDIVSAYHKGVDIGASIGTPIYSSMDGEVTVVSEYGDYGKHLKITNGEISILYAHCSKIDVNVGDKIVQGQKIAEVGSTRKVNWTTSTYRNNEEWKQC